MNEENAVVVLCSLSIFDESNKSLRNEENAVVVLCSLSQMLSR
jgi:hypothetical protein